METFRINYIVLFWLLFQFIIEIKCQQRSTHTTALFDNKLYIFGGFNENPSNYSEVIYHDVSIPFSTKNLSWNSLTGINSVPVNFGAASTMGGANNSTVFIFGGKFRSNQETKLVQTFNAENNLWGSPKITRDENILNKMFLKGIINDGKMYLWGGRLQNKTYTNDMLILDTINLIWGKGSSIGAPTPRSSYNALLLPNNNIIYMGGYNESLLTLREVYIYNTTDDSWVTNKTSGNIPQDRDCFSSVLGLDKQRIIIFGGTTSDLSSTVSHEDSLYVLDLTNFKWYTPKISGRLPKPRINHEANVIGNYMVISFGALYDSSFESDLLLLDIGNNDEYKWTTDFKSDNQEKLSHRNIIIYLIIGNLIGSALLSTGILYIYKKWNNFREKQTYMKSIPHTYSSC